MRSISLIFIFFLAANASLAQAFWQKHQSPTTDTLHNAFFVSARRGWAISHQTGLVVQTVDGGKSWLIQAELGEGYLESIYFTDKRNGWICGENGRLFKTLDGGKNWRSIDVFAKSDAFSALHFFDEKHGFVFGINTETRTGLIFETRDGGKNWLNRSVEIAGKTVLSDAIFRFGKNSFIIGGTSFLRAEKGGSGFELLETKQSGTIRGLFFIDPANGWSVGHRGLLWQTKDGGKNWEKRVDFTGTILRSVYFSGEKTGFIAGNRDETGAALWQTTDGGESWQPVKTDFPNLHRLVSSPKKLWLFGANGAIYSRKR